MMTNKKSIILSACLVWILLIGFIDYLTITYISLSFFYILPIYFASFFIGIYAGFVFSLLSAILYVVTEYFQLEHFQFIHFWNVLMRLSIYLSISYLAYFNKKSRDKILNDKIISDSLKEEVILARNEAENSKNLEELFLAKMSHEIRTPINAVNGLARLLANTELNETQKKYVKGIISSSSHLSCLINDVLDLSKIKSGSLQVDDFNFSLKEKIEVVWNTIINKARKNKINANYFISSDIPDTLFGDANRLNQILINLLANAVKFTKKGSVDLNITCNKIENETIFISFSVKDTGIGVPQEKINDIFKSYSQASLETNQLYGGTGLGLFIVKQLVDIQKGTIEVKSTQGKGSEFSIVIPFKIVTYDKLPLFNQKINRLNFSKSIKILLAEDNHFNQIVTIDVLKLLFDKIEIDLCENGKEVINKVSKKTYDLIIMDVQMPIMDGYEATRKVRLLNNSVNKIPILALSAGVSIEEKQKCLKVGMNDFISKPFEIEDFKNKVLGLLEIHTTKKNNIDTTKSLNHSKLLDFEFLNTITSNNTVAILNYLDLFKKSIHKEVLSINEGFEKLDFAKIKQSIHNLKPSFNYLKASEAEELLKTIVQKSESKENAEDISLLIEKLNKQMPQIDEELQMKKDSLV